MAWIHFKHDFQKRDIIYFSSSRTGRGLTIVLGAKKFMKRKEVEVYPLESFISEFGGALGLFIGFSFMMIWDLIEMLLTILIAKFSIN